MFMLPAEYAKRINKSKAYLSKAMKSGKLDRAISKDAFSNKSKIDPDTADTILFGKPLDIKPSEIEDPKNEKIKSNTHINFSPEDFSHMSFEDIRKTKLAYEGLVERLKYEKQSGALVDKAEIDKKLLAMGVAIRERFLALPKKVIPNMIDKNPFEMQHILTDYITECLEEIANLKLEDEVETEDAE